MKSLRTNYRRRLFLGLGVLFTVTAATFIYALRANPAPNTLAFEGAKVLPQLGLVAIGGAIISYLVFEYQQAHVRSEARVALMRDMLATATTSYNQLKRSRRTLRACGIEERGEKKFVRVANYDEEMGRVIDAELDIERLKEDVRSASSLFSDPTTVVDHLSRVEFKLHDVIAEYERSRPLINDSTTYPMGELPKFNSFIVTRREDLHAHTLGFGVVTEGIRSLRWAIRSDLNRSARRPVHGTAQRRIDGALEARTSGRRARQVADMEKEVAAGDDERGAAKSERRGIET